MEDDRCCLMCFEEDWGANKQWSVEPGKFPVTVVDNSPATESMNSALK